MNSERDLLRRMYLAYNSQNLGGLLTLLTENVDWPDWPRPGRLHGKAAASLYWTQQWTRTRTRDEPIDFTPLPDGRLAARGHQVVRSVGGSVISTGSFHHVFRIDGLLVSRMDIVPTPVVIAPEPDRVSAPHRTPR